jgi:hypothetical protein
VLEPNPGHCFFNHQSSKALTASLLGPSPSSSPQPAISVVLPLCPVDVDGAGLQSAVFASVVSRPVFLSAITVAGSV